MVLGDTGKTINLDCLSIDSGNKIDVQEYYSEIFTISRINMKYFFYFAGWLISNKK
jgi:hypothetical protein